MRTEELGLIGNCQYAALVDRHGTVVWSCLPRFDSPPLFGELLDADGGRFRVGPPSGEAGVQAYRPNTNILETVFRTADGAFRVIDFAPRFALYERSFRPTMLIRVIEPLEGTPQVEVDCAPRLGWSRARPGVIAGSNHVRFEGFASQLRLTTDIPISYLGVRAFSLTQPRHLVLTWGMPVEEPLTALCDRFLTETTRYWQRWVKQCDVPPLFQDEVIRSALVLKLHCYEDTGAIVAATTTSLPESPGSGRTWDYRYCWLRDSYYTLGALQRLGHFEEREQFVQYLLDLAGSAKNLELKPLYRVDGTSDLGETIEEGWAGFEGHGPVRVGNAAALQPQNDIYGEMVLALAPIFFDSRFRQEQSPTSLDILERLARKAIAVAGQPDAGIWELRTTWVPQTFSGVMCWAAADRFARIAVRHAPALATEFAAAAARIQHEVIDAAWNVRLGAFASTYGGNQLDASLLQLAPLRFLPPDDARMVSTIASIRSHLGRGDWLARYGADDGFGTPAVAFTICTFWLVEALALSGRRGEACALLGRVLESLPPLGLLAEDYDPVSGRQWGNFPQAYSHVGLILAAFACSPPWSQFL